MPAWRRSPARRRRDADVRGHGGRRRQPVAVVLWRPSWRSPHDRARRAGRGGDDASHDVAASLLPSLYLGLPLGALVATHATCRARGARCCCSLTVVVSDTAQYYTGPRCWAGGCSRRRSARRRRSRARSAGIVVGTATLVVAGALVAAGRGPVVLASLVGLAHRRRSASSAICSSRCSSAAPA